jgi:CubicO group peptidase (beta-lactamase class C family)
MNYKRTSLVTALVFLFLSFQLVAQTISLPRSEPEVQGVSSKKINGFLDAIANSENEMHSIMIIRHGKVIAEGWWDPYRPDLKHTLYSLSKSFASTAVGFAVAEKRLTVNDKVISFFPDKLPGTVSENLSQLTIKDLLSMSVGQSPDPSGPVGISDDWIKTFLAIPILKKPGTEFLYNSAATYMLSAIVQKVTGEKIIDYLKPRLFDPLGIHGMDWETDPAGINVGGWGLRLKTEDIARMGLLFLQKGKWNGKQLLPASWIEEATTFKTDNAPGMEQVRKDSSDWRQGYCYQFWRCRNNAYRGDGAFGQYMIVMPDQDAVIAITSETPNMQEELNLVWQYLLPAMSPDRSTLNMADALALKKRLATLKLSLPAMADTLSGTLPQSATYKMQSNAKNIESVAVNSKDNGIRLDLKMKGTNYPLNFGNGKWIEGKTEMLGPSLVELAKNHFAGLPPSQVAGAYSWKAKNILEAQLRYIDSPHTLYMTFHFDGDKISVDMQDSFRTPDKKITIKGEKAN